MCVFQKTKALSTSLTLLRFRLLSLYHIDQYIFQFMEYDDYYDDYYDNAHLISLTS